MVLSVAVEDRVVLDDWEAGELSVEYDDHEPQEVIEWALNTFSRERVAICTSFQTDGMAILDMAWRIRPDVRVFTVDTGRLPQETYDLIDRVRQHYGIEVETYFPDTQELQTLVRRHGVNMFYQSVPMRLTCCDVRKVRPLVKVLHGLDAWVTGLRRDQWATRSNIRKIELDHDHGGIVKVNPLADWTDEEVWDYIRDNEVPYHPLYDQGYQSIGCAPCTRPVEPGANARSGRWWWEKNGPKECGMHCAVETGGFEHELEVLVGSGGLETEKLKLEPAEADVLAADAAAFAGALADATAQARYVRLAEAARAGEVPEELVPALEAMLELLFDKGRPSNRAVLQAIFGKTPRGRRQRAAAREVNKALKALSGQRLENLRLAAGPSRHTLVVETDRCKLTLELDSAGARVASLETG